MGPEEAPCRDDGAQAKESLPSSGAEEVSISTPFLSSRRVTFIEARELVVSRYNHQTAAKTWTPGKPNGSSGAGARVNTVPDPLSCHEPPAGGAAHSIRESTNAGPTRSFRGLAGSALAHPRDIVEESSAAQDGPGMSHMANL